MKVRIFICLFICFNLYAFGQNKDISGVYYAQSGMYIKVKNDNFYLIIPQTHSPVWFNDTLANCTFKWVDKNFIELNSTPPNIITLKGLNVVQSSDSTVKDSIKISFSIPYQRWKLKITVHTNTSKTFDLVYSKSNRELILPNNVKSISFYIVPEHIIPHTSDGLFYGIVGFDSFQECQIEKNINHILIEIPAIDDSFFERYYIKGDYVKVSKDSITWKGEVFVKEK